jgi:cytosol alanyl aminopeptidase
MKQRRPTRRGPWRGAPPNGWVLLAAFLASSCIFRTPATVAVPDDRASAASAASPSPSPAPPPVRDDGLLPDTVVPVHYGLTLHIDPSLATYSGQTTITVDVPAPASHVVVNARGLKILSVTAMLPSGPELRGQWTTRKSHDSVSDDELVVSFASPLPVGQAKLVFAHEAPFATNLTGIYRVYEDGRWYAYSQFEPTDARGAFPCFDEPRFKTPFDVRIVTPEGNVALSNAPESPFSGTEADHARVFETTPPLPTYLVAFAVGPFDVVEGAHGPASSGVPIRAVTTHGRGGLTGLALETADALLAKLADYFDLRYPYAKLDLVAVPDFAMGGMEHPGLVTFREALIMVDREHATTSARRTQAMVIAHEFAHQWFGDLVTMQWWDDLWLNEGFATWAAAKIVDSWRPSFGAVLEQVAGAQSVMDLDALQHTRAVRGPVRSTNEAREAFDALTYDKGAAVLRMIEAWVGPDVFRRAVHRYLTDHAWKTARAGDLFKAIDFVSAQSVDAMASGFLDQTGIPEVFVQWTCEGLAAGKLELRQSEWRPLGADRAATPRTWTLPVCIASDAQRAKTCFTLGAEPLERSLGAACPSWVYPNAGEAGYYRFVLDRRQIAALAGRSRSLDPAERLGLLSNVWAAVRQGSIAPSVLLDLLPAFDGETNRMVVEQIIGSLGGVDAGMVDDATRPAFRRFAAARLAPRKRALGWEDTKLQADDERAIARRSILWAMAEMVGDAATLDEAEKYARRWLADPKSVSGDVSSVAVPLASKRAGALRLNELREAAKRASTPQDRITALRAMGMFDDPVVLRQALDLVLTDEIKISEIRYPFNEAASRREARAVVFAWERDNWPQLRNHLPGTFGGHMLVDFAGYFCTPAERDEVVGFLRPATQGIEGTQRALDEATERAGLCIALRRANADPVTAYFSRR